MKGIQIDDGYVAKILQAHNLSGKLVESKDANADQDDSLDESDESDHICPLCESALDEELSDARLQEFVDYALDVIDEALEESDGESIDEDLEDEDDE